MPDRLVHHPHVQTVLMLRRFLEGLGDDRPQRGHEDQRIDHRCRQRRDQRDRHVFHEFADDPRPEQQRREGGDPGQGRGDHRAGHAVRRLGIGLALVHPLAHAPLGIFHDDDRVIDQHPHGQDQAEQHHKVHRQPGHLQSQNAHQEGCRNRQTDQDRRPHGQRIENHDEHQHHRRQDRILQITQQLADGDGLVLAERHHHAFGHLRLQGIRRGFDLIHRLDQVGPDALGHLDGDRRLAVQPRHRVGVFQRRVDFRKVFDRHHGIAIGHHGQLGKIFHRFDQRGHLDGVASLRPFHGPGCNQAVVGIDAGNQCVRPQVVG